MPVVKTTVSLEKPLLDFVDARAKDIAEKRGRGEKPNRSAVVSDLIVERKRQSDAKAKRARKAADSKAVAA